jgi:hypothetical protein
MLLLANVISNTIKTVKENFKTVKEKESVNIMDSLFLSLLILILAVVPAVLVSQQCNPSNKVGYGILAFLFADIYLFQWAIRKFVMNTPDYCLMA